MGVMAIILIIIILKTSLQVIRGASSRREPLKSISEAYCIQWKIKPVQDCCADAVSLTCVMGNHSEAKYGGSFWFFWGVFLFCFAHKRASRREH